VGERHGEGDALARSLRRALRLHQDGALAAAAALYEEILARAPAHADALHLLGLARHQDGRHADALTLIDRAIAQNPRPAAYHNSAGVVLLALGRPADAEAAFSAALARDPVYAEALNNLGNARQEQGRAADAVACYEDAIALKPDDPAAHANHARALLALRRPEAACTAARRAIKLRPGHANAWRTLGEGLGELGRREDAEAAFRKACELAAKDAENWAALAAHLERSGRLDDALAIADRALGLEPDNIRAAVVAARCERRLGRPEAGLARLQTLDPPAAPPAARAHLVFEKAALCDRLGAWRDAFAHYAEANRLMLRTPEARRIDRDAYPRLIQRLQTRFSADWTAGWSKPPPPDPRAPIFLVGFPRSGTTLLDQILDAHPALTTLSEKDPLDWARAEVARLPGGYPDALAGLSADAIQRLRARYFARVAEHLGGPPAGRLVDKMPLNIIDAGLIFRLFADAKVILALRHPCDVVLSGFMQPFVLNETMIHFTSLESTARFYAAVMGLWRRYARVLALDVASVRYEHLVADFAGETRRLLTFLGLPWDDAVLGYAQRAQARTIATPSYHQVVQPIYGGAVGRWHHYASAFAPVLPLLRPLIEAFGYSADAG
jgi:tetratricopeptide (TPR) repeat protein